MRVSCWCRSRSARLRRIEWRIERSSWKVLPRVSARNSRVRTKSSSSSSTSRTFRQRSSMLFGAVVVGQLDDFEPIFAEGPHDLDQGGKFDRLGDVGIDAQVVGACDVLFRLGGGEDDDGDVAELGVVFDFAQGLATVLARHV